jgi:hypothetical protein
MSDINAPARITKGEVAKMQEAIDSLQTRLNAMTAPRVGEPKVREPTPFNGKHSSQLTDFLAQVRVAFEVRPSKYPTEKTKVLYAVSYLEGAALAYFQPFIGKADPPSWMTNFALFADELEKCFGDPDLIGNVTFKLRKLKQTGSASAYAAEFRQLASRLSWNEQALVSQFFNGLKDPVQDELVKIDYPMELNAIIPLAIRIDNLQHQRTSQRNLSSRLNAQVPKKHQSMYVASKPQTVVPTQLVLAPSTVAQSAAEGYGHRPMELDATRPVFQRLTEQQREYRRKNNLCMYCGKPGHVALQCLARPKHRPRPARLAEVTWTHAQPSGNDHAQL